MKTETPSHPETPGVGREGSVLLLKPSLLGALRAAWLFAWKTEFTLRRLAVAIIGLLVLPALVYITTQSPGGWNRRHSPLGNSGRQVNEFARHLRAEAQLKPEQRVKLVEIFREEYSRADADLRAGEQRDTPAEQQTARVKACYERIEGRLRTVLNKDQLHQFHRFKEGLFTDAQQRMETPQWKRTGPFYHWLIDFYFFVLLPLNCVRTSGSIIRDELQADTLGFLITRPLSRATLLVVKYFSQTAWLELTAIAEALLLFAAGSLRQIPEIWALVPLFLAVQFLAVLAWSALGALLGLVTQRYMAVAVVYGLIVEMGIGRIPTNINTLSLMRHLKTILAHNPALQEVYSWTGSGVAFSIGAVLFACLLFLTMASLLFTFREYHHTAEMQR